MQDLCWNQAIKHQNELLFSSSFIRMISHTQNTHIEWRLPIEKPLELMPLNKASVPKLGFGRKQPPHHG